MDRERLTRLLQEPGRVAREDLGDLRGLVERYPWFAGGHLLLAQGEHAADDVLSEASLLNAAAHLPSRTVLFDAFRASSEAPLKPIERPAETPLLPEEEKSGPVTLHVVPKGIDLVEPVEDIAPEAKEDDPARESTVLETPENVTESDRETVPPEAAILERQIFEAALASSYELTRELQLERSAEKIQEEPSAPEARDAQDDGQFADALPEAPVESTDAVPALKPSGRYRFTDWITSPTNAEGIADPTRSPLPEEESGTKEAAALPLPSVPPAALIDRFIQSQNPEPQRKAEFFTPQQAGKRSLEEQAGLVTETLARIYAQQGNIAKAREAYRKLALKYPDKSVYFAALENELED